MYFIVYIITHIMLVTKLFIELFLPSFPAHPLCLDINFFMTLFNPNVSVCFFCVSETKECLFGYARFYVIKKDKFVHQILK